MFMAVQRFSCRYGVKVNCDSFALYLQVQDTSLRRSLEISLTLPGILPGEFRPLVQGLQDAPHTVQDPANTE